MFLFQSYQFQSTLINILYFKTSATDLKSSSWIKVNITLLNCKVKKYVVLYRTLFCDLNN